MSLKNLKVQFSPPLFLFFFFLLRIFFTDFRSAQIQQKKTLISENMTWVGVISISVEQNPFSRQQSDQERRQKVPGEFYKNLEWIETSAVFFIKAFNGAYLQHPKIFHPRALILSFSSLHFILTNSSLHFNPLNFIFTNSSPVFYPTPLNPFYIICYISYSPNSYSSK